MASRQQMNQVRMNHPPSLPAGSAYRRDIDGLRSIAVLSVITYHAGMSAPSGGFAGVDIFFVISGYLITSVILQEQRDNRFSLRTFYIRRARRLFPALFTVLAASTVVAWWLLMPREMEDFGESLATAAAFGSNFMFWSEAGYFDGPSEFKPLLHTWSLAIEEQYYLLFPLLLLVCRSSERYLSILLPVALVSLVLSEVFITRAPSAAFFLLPHRLWELMIGSLLAAAAIREPHWFANWPNATREFVAFAGLTAISVTVFGYSDGTPFPGRNALLPTLGTACVVAAGIGGSTMIGKALSTPPLVAIGLISYSLYLWHWPVLVFTKLYLVRPPKPSEIQVAVCSTFLLGWLTWRFVEQPFRIHRSKVVGVQSSGGLLPDSKILATSLGCMALLITGGVFLDTTDGAPNRLPESIQAISRVTNDKPATRKHCSNIDPDEVSTTRLCSLGNNTQPPDFILWGDSHAMFLAPRFAEVAKVANRRGLNATANGCAALLNTYRPGADPDRDCVHFNTAILELIATTPSIKTVVLAGRWAIYTETTRYKHESGQPLQLADALANNGRAGGKAESNSKIWERSLRRTLKALEGLNKNVIVIASIPEIGWDTPNIIARSVHLNRPISIAPTLDEHLARQRQVWPVLNTLNVRVLNPQKYLCDSSICRAAQGGAPLYIDEDHLSSAGTRLLLPLVREALSEPPEP